MRQKITIAELTRKHWLPFAVLATILFASSFPSLGINGGPLRPELTVKCVLVWLMFFINGLNIKSGQFWHSVRNYRVHLFVQSFNFLFTPFLVWLCVNYFNVIPVNGWVLKGFLSVSCMPPTISTAVIFTRQSKGNDSTAILNSLLGTVLGTIATPLLIFLNLGYTALVPFGEILLLSTITVIFPFVLGQMAARLSSFQLSSRCLRNLSHVALLLMTFTSFCEMFHAPEMGPSAGDILFSVFFVLVLQIALLWIAHGAAVYFQFDQEDCTAIVFCCTQKSLNFGIPLLRNLFHGFSHLSQITLPLLAYQSFQVVLGSLVVSLLKNC